MNNIKKGYSNSELEWLEVEYIGEVDRLSDFPLEMFNDLETGSTFIRREGESIVEARDRIRNGFKKYQTGTGKGGIL
jgi:hypothetical protein